MRNVGILGTGLIGASIGLGLRSLGMHVTGWDTDEASAEVAARRGALDTVASSEIDVVSAGSDLLILAASPSVIVDLVARLDHPGLVIDVAGVKGPILAASKLARFVGTHPMAGREVSGPEAASPVLFRGATWVVTTDGATSDDLNAVCDLVSTLGARPITMSAAEHDTAVATISHVPQLLAAGLVATATGSERALDLAAGSFRDLTRVAASDPALWVDVLQTNKLAVSVALEGMRKRIDELGTLLEGDAEALASFLSDARVVRRAMTALVATVRVALADQPGELAKVGRALQTSAVDVRDFQLRHAPHGGGGVLTLSVRPGDGETLQQALEAEGLLLVD